MTTLKSKTTLIEKPSVHIFDFLSNMENFLALMPEEITDKTSTEKTCTFTVKGMTTLTLVQTELKSPNIIKLKAEQDHPFPLEMAFYFNENSHNIGTQVESQIEAKMNPMIKMMASRPLTNLLDMINENLKSKLQPEK